MGKNKEKREGLHSKYEVTHILKTFTYKINKLKV
jgi:hypothetical protein